MLRILPLVLALLLPTIAGATPVQFALPAQSAADALLEFSRQAGVEVLFAFDELHGVQSRAVEGRFEPMEVLARLLQDTGFYARRTEQGKFIVARLARPTGSIKGRLVTQDRKPAHDVRVGIAGTQHVTATDDNGEFTLSRVPPGTHRLVVAASGYRPLEIVDVRVEANRVVNVETNTLQAAEDVVLLSPQIVEGKFYRRWKARSIEDFHPQEAAGNLDLPRSEDDALPYTIYDREQIARSGVVNLNEFLQRNVLDSAAGTLPPEQLPGNDADPPILSSSTNLTMRGYKADETAILVNGRRLPEVLTSKTTDARPPDVNFIPLSLVDRVEVLPVSASALYSGNPVGGVINIVLRPDVNYTEVTGTYTNAVDRFDASQSSISLQHGETLLGGRLRVRLNATFTQANPPNESELGYIQRDLASTPSETPRATPNVSSADGSPLFGPGTPAFTSVAPGSGAAAGRAAFLGREGVRSTALFDTPGGLANSQQSGDYAYGRGQSSSSYFGSATYDVSPWLQLGFDGMYSHSVVHRGYNVFPGNLVLSAESPFNPFGQAVNVSLNETVPGLGEDFAEGRIDFCSAVVGALLKLPADWRVSIDSQYGHSLTKYRGIYDVDAGRWQQLVDAGLYNPLRDTQLYGPPPEFYDRALIYYGRKGQFVTLGDYETFDAAVRVTNQSVPLPTGSGAVNFGGDYRINRLHNFTDEKRYGTGEYAADPTRWRGRQIERVSVFGELVAPLLPERWLPRPIRSIEADLAARYVAAATAQETNLAPTGGLKIDLAGGFALRGSIATSNRFPSPFMSRAVAKPGGPAGGDLGYALIKDPRRGGEEYLIKESTALNPNLRSEANVTRAVGLVYQRGSVHRFRLAVDYSNTRKSGEQVTLYTNAVMNLESLFPERVLRDPPNDARYPVGRVTQVFTGPINLAWRESQHWMTTADYSWTHCFGGRLDVYGRWSYYSQYDIKYFPDQPMVDELNAPDGNAPGLLKHRMNFGTSWTRPGYGFGLDGHYYHSRSLRPDEWVYQHRRQINPFWQFDAFVQGDVMRLLPWKSSRFGLRAQFRVNNILNANPPRYALDPSRAGVQQYSDWRGQTYAVTLQATF
jgi:outer membrane receptor protein involved in Fe transport